MKDKNENYNSPSYSDTIYQSEHFFLYNDRKKSGHNLQFKSKKSL